MNKRLVFSFTSAGFFSEVNNLLLAILYGHKNNFEIVIDFGSIRFIDVDSLNKILNLKVYNILNSNIISNASTRGLKTYLYDYSGYIKFIQFLKYLIYYIRYKIYEFRNNPNLDLLQRHWSKIRNLRFNLNDEDKIFLYSTVQKLWIHKSPKESNFKHICIGVHLRRGDKVLEIENISLNQYYNEIVKQSKIIGTKEVFLFTDLLEDGLKLKKRLRGYNVSLNYIDDEGYYHEEFLKLPIEIKINKTLLLCDIVNRMACTSHFIGSNDGNLSAFISLLRAGEDITDLRNDGLLMY